MQYYMEGLQVYSRQKAAYCQLTIENGLEMYAVRFHKKGLPETHSKYANNDYNYVSLLHP